MFPSDALQQLTNFYPEKHGRISHSLLDHPLLTLEALVALAQYLPQSSVEHNPGNLPIGIDPDDVPSPLHSIADTIRSIEDNGSWMVLKRIEQHPDYAKLLSETLAEIEPLVRQRTGGMLGQEGFIFVSSPGSVTPFHFDPEHNILLQIRGKKTMTVFPADDEAIVSPQSHEAFHMGQHHRNQVWRDEFAAKGEAIELTPADAIYVPVKAPHWVQNGSAVSISLSITWRSEWSYEEADARGFNRVARKLGMVPASPRRYPARNRGKSLVYRVLRRINLDQ